MDDSEIKQPLWTMVLPIGSVVLLLAMYATHGNFNPSHTFLWFSIAPILLGTAALASRMQKDLVGCRYRSRLDRQYRLFTAAQAWREALMRSLLCVFVLVFFADSLGNTLFGGLHYHRYVITGKFIRYQRWGDCDVLQLSAIGRGPELGEICVSISAERNDLPGQLLLVGDQRSWFGHDVVSYHRLPAPGG